VAMIMREYVGLRRGGFFEHLSLKKETKTFIFFAAAYLILKDAFCWPIVLNEIENDKNKS